MIHVVATVTLQPQARETFLQEFARLRPEVLREDGCLAYEASIDHPSGLARQIGLRADVVTILERWHSVAALQAHSTAPHMQGFRERVASLVRSTELQVLQPVAEAG
jgi:quinol monooxygenase YgiN